MAPRTTQPHNRTSAPATRKRGESDPNNPPKKHKTRHSKADSNDMDVEEHEGGNIEVKNREVQVKSGRRAKKTGRYVPSLTFFLFLFFVSFILIFHSLIMFVYSRKTTLAKNNEVATFQDNNRPLPR